MRIYTTLPRFDSGQGHFSAAGSWECKTEMPVWDRKITNWKDVGASDLEIKLTYEDNPKDASGVLGAFKEYIVGEKGEMIKGAVFFGEPQERGEYVSNTPGGITFMGLKSYQERFDKMLHFDDTAPTKENILKGVYPITATYYIIYDSTRKTAAEEFLSYMGSENGRSTINRNYVAAPE